MFFHSVNAYDYIDEVTGDQNIHVDLCSYEGDYCPYRECCLSNMVNGTSIHGRNTSPLLVSGREQGHPIQDWTRDSGVPMELPQIKYAPMKPGYHYVYATGGNVDASPGTEVPIGRLGNGFKCVQEAFFGSIAKIDWLTSKFAQWHPKNGESCPCEPVFVARPVTARKERIVFWLR